jgi:hypothetical protein
MATFNSALFSAQDETRVATGRLAEPNLASGTVEFAIVPYTLAGTEDEATPDIIKLCLLPAGAIPIPELSAVICETDPGTALTLDVGTAADPDGWLRGLAFTVAARLGAMDGTLPAWLTTKTPIVADTGSGNAVVYATVALGTALTAGTKLQFVLAWKRAR